MSKLLNLKCFPESLETVKFEKMLTTNGFALLYTVNEIYHEILEHMNRQN